MSSKNTPTPIYSRSRLKKFENAKESTPKSLGKKEIPPVMLLSNRSTSKKAHSFEKPLKNLSNPNESLLNNAFTFQSSVCGNKLTPSRHKDPKISLTPMNTSCTPSSSLYRTCTTSRSVTPKVNNVKKLNTEPKTPECFSKVSIDSSKKSVKSGLYQDDKHNPKNTEVSNLTVAVRVRPLNSQECLNSNVTNCIQVYKNEVIVSAGPTADNSAGLTHCFQYDYAFWSCNTNDPHYSNQDTIFKGTGLQLIEKAFAGYNACLFAYGQTGSGKSYSMMGIENDDNDEISSEAGIIPRFCQELFQRINLKKNKIQAEIEISYFEIYNEKIHDLLCVSSFNDQISSNSQYKNALRVREHPMYGPYVVDLSTHPVDSYNSLKNWLTVGNSQRATAATGMNDKSSRSHSILNIVLILSEVDEENSKNIAKQTKRSKISLVDLAGSERISHKDSCEERIREGVSINKSLLTLGKVISALADTKKTSNFVPYRESVLTWLLRESLGGNSKTAMLATISPASIHIEETLATLRYACQARTIVNRVKVNEDPHDKIIRELRAEVDRLQVLRQEFERQQQHSTAELLPPRKIIIETSVDETEVEALKLQLAETEKELEKAQKSWSDRLKEAENLRKAEMKILKRKGLALQISADQKQACLVNLAADPLLSNTLFYIIPNGIVRIGRPAPTAFSQPDIVLDGPLVAFHHCTIENINGRLYITPDSDEFETYLNGEILKERNQMLHGDRLVIGGSHYFRISNPNCFYKQNNNEIIDFKLAHQEILSKQEEQLRWELDQEKTLALTQIEKERAASEQIYKEQLQKFELEKLTFKCNKELLETEKRIFKDQQNLAQEKFEYTPYKSTILDDIKKIMEHPTQDSLHKTQIKVREATQRCRNLGFYYDFKQSQVIDEFGIFRAVVTIIDKANRLKAEWPTARLDVWLDIIRDTNNITQFNLFDSVDTVWSPLTENLDNTDSSLNSSRISLNLSAVKDVILKESNFQKFRDLISPKRDSPNSKRKDNFTRSAVLNSCSIKKLKNTKKMLVYDDDDIIELNYEQSAKADEKKSFSSSAYIHLKDIQKSTLKLKKLCDTHRENQNDLRYESIQKSIDMMQNIIFDLQATLNEQKLTDSPSKTPKSVRFLID